HRNVVSNVRSILGYLPLTPDDSVAMVLPFHYVYGASVLNTHVAAGGTVVVPDSRAFSVSVLETMAEHSVTGFSGVPATFAHLLCVSSLPHFRLSSLRYVTQAGAAMPVALIRRLRALLPRARVLVMSGQMVAAGRLAWLPPDQLDWKLGS